MKKAGINWTCQCPFHKENNASFTVKTQYYTCYGCNNTGDVITFVRKFNNWSYGEAIEWLAERYGIDLKDDKLKEIRKTRTEIYDINKIAQDFYNNNLLTSLEAKEARTYLLNRGITEEHIKEFGFGYAPKKATALIEYLEKTINITREFLVNASLTSKTESGDYIDFFRHGRIMIPIKDESGRIIAFGGRLLFESTHLPKYLNSRDTPIYKKNNVVFGINLAYEHIKKENSVIVMEGYFDAITAYINGIKNAVAVCSAKLSVGQIKMLSKYSKNFYLAFDIDDAGIKGAESANTTIMSSGDDYSVSVIVNDTGKDPDEYIRLKDAESYKNLINNAQSYYEYQIMKIIKSVPKGSGIDGKKVAIVKLLPILKDIYNSVVRNMYIDLISSELKIDKFSIIEELKKKTSNTSSSTLCHQKKTKIKINPKILGQRTVLTLFFIKRDLIFKQFISHAFDGIEMFDSKYNTLKDILCTTVNGLDTDVDYKDIDENGKVIKDNTDAIINLATTMLEDNEEFKGEMINIYMLAEEYNHLDDKQICNFLSQNLDYIEKMNAKVEVQLAQENLKRVASTGLGRDSSIDSLQDAFKKYIDKEP